VTQEYEQMAKKRRYKRLFETAQLGKMVLPNRLMMAPMNLGFTEYPYNFSRQYIDAIEARAKGGVGTIITAHVKAESQIDPYPVSGMLACLDRESNLKNFAEVAEVVHRHGAKIIIQLSAGTGRLADQPLPESWPASPSPLPILNQPHLLTRELSLDEISGLVEAYGKASDRAKRAGYDAIMVHCAGSYLIGQFLSSKWNQRTDRYGGSLPARMRFMEECIESARSMVGRDFPILAVLSTDSKIEGAPPIEDAEMVARRLEELGILALLLRTGSYDSKDWVIPPIYYPRGCRVPYTQPVKEAVNLPIILDGRIDTPEFAEKLLEEGKADFIALGRPLLADPEWPKKAEQGRADEIRGCIYCNECYTRVTSRRYAKCAVNPDLGREKEYKSWHADRQKKVVVVGGGPGGMRAATIAGRRGHQVTLYEKAEKLGGNLRAASSPEFKTPMRPIIDWLTREVNKAGVTVKLGQEVTAKTIKEIKPDVVILATGSVPALPDITGVKGRNVATAVDVLLGKTQVSDEVVVVGGGYVGCETALHLARMGKKVTIVEMLPDIALDAGAIEREALVRLLAEAGVKLATNMKVNEIVNGGVVAGDREGQRHEFHAGSVILATGMKANDGLYEELKGTVAELYKIGDAAQPRRVLEAIHEGEAAAHLL
jgi:2-enoate reductase